MNRNQILINIIGAIIVITLGLFIFEAVSGTGGLNINSAGIAERDSYRYVKKSVNSNADRIVKTGNAGYEEGSANIVSSIVVNYRMFDTLGEILVLFASTAGVGLLLASRKKSKIKDATSIAQTAVSLISLIAVVLGAFIIVHGHLSPGGGFSGGAIVASALILMILILKSRINNKAFLLLESISGFAILGIGLAGFLFNKTFFQNFLPTGTIGELFSSGTVIILYILIGIKVMSEIFSIGYYFLKESS